MADCDTRCFAYRAQRRFRSLHPALFGLCRRSGVAPGARAIEFTGKVPGNDRGSRVEPQLITLTGRRDSTPSIGAVLPLLRILLLPFDPPLRQSAISGNHSPSRENPCSVSFTLLWARSPSH